MDVILTLCYEWLRCTVSTHNNFLAVTVGVFVSRCPIDAWKFVEMILETFIVLWIWSLWNNFSLYLHAHVSWLSFPLCVYHTAGLCSSVQDWGSVSANLKFLQILNSSCGVNALIKSHLNSVNVCVVINHIEITLKKNKELFIEHRRGPDKCSGTWLWPEWKTDSFWRTGLYFLTHDWCLLGQGWGSLRDCISGNQLQGIFPACMASQLTEASAAFKFTLWS